MAMKVVVNRVIARHEANAAPVMRPEAPTAFGTGRINRSGRHLGAAVEEQADAQGPH